MMESVWKMFPRKSESITISDRHHDTVYQQYEREDEHHRTQDPELVYGKEITTDRFSYHEQCRGHKTQQHACDSKSEPFLIHVYPHFMKIDMDIKIITIIRIEYVHYRR